MKLKDIDINFLAEQHLKFADLIAVGIQLQEDL